MKAIAIACAGLLLTGCATFSTDGGLDAVSALTAERTGQSVRFAKPEANTVAALPNEVLTPDAAVRIALLNSPALKASLAELGIAEADLVQAGRLRNPGFSFSRLRGDDLEIERSILFDLAGLFTMPLRKEVESRRFEQAKLQAAAQAVRLAGDTRKAYFAAVAAQQGAHYMEQAGAAAEAGAELAQRMAQAGNWSKLAQAREQAFHTEAAAQAARARHEALAAREKLARLMGVRDASALRLPERLPDLPKTMQASEGVGAQAMQQRLDIRLAQSDTEATAKALGLTKASRFVNVLDLGYANKSISGQPRENGYVVELELPLFDWGDAKSARAEAVYMQSLQRTADVALRARSEVRESYSAYRTAYELASRYRDEVLPLRKQISEEMLLRYNGMLSSVFDLLADAREQIHAVHAAIEAQRDFWLADTELQAAINGASPLSAKDSP